MKRLIASLTAASLALSLAACGGAASSSAAANSSGAASSSAAASSAKPTTVTVWHLQPDHHRHRQHPRHLYEPMEQRPRIVRQGRFV